MTMMLGGVLQSMMHGFLLWLLLLKQELLLLILQVSVRMPVSQR